MFKAMLNAMSNNNSHLEQLAKDLQQFLENKGCPLTLVYSLVTGFLRLVQKRKASRSESTDIAYRIRQLEFRTSAIVDWDASVWEKVLEELFYEDAEPQLELLPLETPSRGIKSSSKESVKSIMGSGIPCQKCKTPVNNLNSDYCSECQNVWDSPSN